MWWYWDHFAYPVAPRFEAELNPKDKVREGFAQLFTIYTLDPSWSEKNTPKFFQLAQEIDNAAILKDVPTIISGGKFDWTKFAAPDGKNPRANRRVDRRATGRVGRDTGITGESRPEIRLGLREGSLAGGVTKNYEQTTSDIKPIDPEQALADIARMLGKDYDAKVVEKLGGKAGTWKPGIIRMANLHRDKFSQEVFRCIGGGGIRRNPRREEVTEEERRIIALACGMTPPNSGIEIHFLKVLTGEAHPCSDQERKWLGILHKAKEQKTHEEMIRRVNEQARRIERLQEELEQRKRELAAYRFRYGEIEHQAGANDQENWKEMDVETLRKWRAIRLSLNLPIPKEIEEQELYKPEWLRGVTGAGPTPKARWVPATRSGVPSGD